jgi:hypothetical protein
MVNGGFGRRVILPGDSVSEGRFVAAEFPFAAATKRRPPRKIFPI